MVTKEEIEKGLPEGYFIEEDIIFRLVAPKRCCGP